eukprot:UN5138
MPFPVNAFPSSTAKEKQTVKNKETMVHYDSVGDLDEDHSHNENYQDVGIAIMPLLNDKGEPLKLPTR